MLSVPSPLVYCHLVGEAVVKASSGGQGRALAVYAKVKLCDVTVIGFLDAARHGIDYRTTSDWSLWRPLYGGVLVSLVSPLSVVLWIPR